MGNLGGCLSASPETDRRRKLCVFFVTVTVMVLVLVKGMVGVVLG